MHAVDWLGISGSLLVFGSFWMKSTVPLRILALASNVVFIAYAYAAWLIPILVLHCALLPVNLMRLRQHLLHLKADGKRPRRVAAGTLPVPAGHTGTMQKTMRSSEGSASEAF